MPTSTESWSPGGSVSDARVIGRDAGPTAIARTNWNYADVWELIAREQPDRPALVHGDRVVDWARFDREADGVAQWLLGLGLERHDVVALCLRNRPEYLIATFGCMKVAVVPANTNVRYTEEELHALWSQVDVRTVIYDAVSAGAVEPLIDRLPQVRGWLRVPIPGIAAGDPRVSSWPEVAALDSGGPARPAVRGRSGDDPYVLFTGGTTGLPKGVLWRQDDLFTLLNRTVQTPWDEGAGLVGIADRLRAGAARSPRLVVAAPLMHGLGALTSISALATAGTVVTLTGASYSATEFLDTVESVAATQATIVGDAMAGPMLRAIEDDPSRWTLDSLRVLLSSGTGWTAAIKHAIAQRFPRIRCVDVLGATEAIGVASAVTTTGHSAGSTGRFVLGPDAGVVDAQRRPVVPGSGMPGRVVVRGRAPIGYLGDQTTTTATFFEVAGERWTLLGDWATVEADGTIQLLGRGSSVINTGGEKVFPDEVEHALRACTGVLDAAVVGVAHPRLGQQVVALVVTEPGHRFDAAALRERLRADLAGFKVPRVVHAVDALGRATNGKLDRPALERRAAELTTIVADRGVASHAR
jgi:3-oxocholest-4-en-26-oate---CoA ligase